MVRLLGLGVLLAPAAIALRGQAPSENFSYHAAWNRAIALIDSAQVTPDHVASPARDSLYHRAIRLARHAVAIHPDSAEGWFALSYALGRSTMTLGARDRVRHAVAIRESAERALALDPGHDGAHHVLGRWHAEVMRLPAIRRFVARRFLGGARFADASWDRAAHHLERAASLDPGRVVHRLDLALIYRDMGRGGDSRREAEAALRLPPRDALDPRYQCEAEELLRSLPDPAAELPPG